MQDQPPRLPDDTEFSIRSVRVDGDPLPLARARNCAADAAIGESLAFLDVDCIPDPAFVQRAAEAIEDGPEGVYLPEVRYLPANPQGWLNDDELEPDFAALQEQGERHPAKPDLVNCAIRAIEDFGELWGLAFILTADTWRAASGMNEDYVGYGAEETDFGRRLQRSGVALFWLGGTVCYHQHHTVHKPPLQHFESIVRNARLFRSLWGEWCMDYWLDDFARRGLIERSETAIRVLREPDAAELESARQGPDVRFS